MAIANSPLVKTAVAGEDANWGRVVMAIGKAGDVDTAAVLMKTRSGRIAQISNSRRATYGYDQRIEVFGSGGRLTAGNRLESTVELANADGQTAAKPMHFFLERYAEAIFHAGIRRINISLDSLNAFGS